MEERLSFIPKTLVLRQYHNHGVNFKGHSYIRQLGRQLDCSTNYPLSISICSIVKEHPPQDLPPQLEAILFSFSSRIQELHLYLTSSILSQMSDMQLSLPSLESLILLCQDRVSGIFENLRLFSYTPKLQSLEVIDWRDGLELPWSQLKKYHSDHRYISTGFHGPQAHHHLNSLRKLRQAEECALRLSGTSLAREFGGRYLSSHLSAAACAGSFILEHCEARPYAVRLSTSRR